MKKTFSYNALSYYARTFLFISILSAWCMGMLIFRAYISHKITFFFLVWNLFLAFIPWLLSVWAKKIYHKGTKRYFIVPVVATWLLFYPNAPYILTDLFHLRQRPYIPLWYDLTLILSFAWTGLYMGMLSLRYLHDMIHEWKGKRAGWIFTFLVLMLSGFGIYAGRFLRWNSWDIISNPFSLFSELAAHLRHPFAYLSGWGMTLFFGMMLTLIYMGVYFFSTGEEQLRYQKR